MKAYKCDRCGKLFEEYPDRKSIIVEYPWATCTHLDLCEDCGDEFHKWLDYLYSIEPDKEVNLGRMD